MLLCLSCLSIISSFAFVELVHHLTYPFVQTTLLAHIHCNGILVGLQPLISVATSILDPPGNLSWISCCCLKSWRSCSYCFPKNSPFKFFQVTNSVDIGMDQLKVRVGLGGIWVGSHCLHWAFLSPARWGSHLSCGHTIRVHSHVHVVRGRASSPNKSRSSLLRGRTSSSAEAGSAQPSEFKTYGSHGLGGNTGHGHEHRLWFL